MRTPAHRRRHVLALVVFVALVALGGLIGLLAGSHTASPQTRRFVVHARQYAYDPPVIRVNRGDTVRLRLVSDDVVHGFYLEGHDLDVDILPLEPKVLRRWPSRPDEVEEVDEVVFVADKEGKFRYRCSHTCGFLHPFMLGELIVGPNRLLPTSLGMTLGMLVGGFLFVRIKTEEP
jgi:heme/copper-type cytochrome/quinol oxidase subunit 2